MKRIFLLLIIFLNGLCSLSLSAQSIDELKEMLAEAETRKEKMILNKKLGDAYLRVDSKEALKYAKKAHELALQVKDKGMSGSTSYLVAQVYERQRNKRNQEVWLKSTQKYAKQAKDSDLLIKSTIKRSDLARKERNWRRAYEINQEAFDYFSQKGTSMSDLESNFELQKSQIARATRKLEDEKQDLLAEINNLSAEKKSLVRSQTKLVKEKAKVESKISEKEKELQSASQEKEKAERLAKVKEQEVKELNREALEKEAILSDTRANLAEAEAEKQKAEAEALRNENLRNLTILGAAFVVVLALFFFSLYRSSRRSKRKLEETNKIIEQERERSDELLLNILPSEIASELKEYGKAKARKYDEVTVLFSDFKNFTRISEQLTPEELVEELDKCFKAFDFIIAQHKDIEKIKTIGDAYMCASGLSNSKTVPTNLIKAALEMQEFLDEQKQERLRLGKPYFEARIGIHTGPVVAGVVGVNKFAYDIWGDTVNIAARMESNSEVGRVNISETTYHQVRHKFKCEYRGKVQAKNKGAIDMYYVQKLASYATA